ncbi:hypothetical protein AMECASPLE_033589 [Ameca splendens]|uniref:Uncharacterized protein n=1 Tax=Ameca splendens TaxID=208324 RepID=A0ABV0Z4T5_9TELE
MVKKIFHGSFHKVNTVQDLPSSQLDSLQSNQTLQQVQLCMLIVSETEVREHQTRPQIWLNCLTSSALRKTTSIKATLCSPWMSGGPGDPGHSSHSKCVALYRQNSSHGKKACAPDADSATCRLQKDCNCCFN